MNKIIITGRLTRDPELKQTNGGTSVCNFAVAVDRSYKDKDGNRQADFFDISAFNQRAEFISKYFKKGSFIAISGAMESRKYTDKEGHNRIAWGITVEDAQFCGSKPDNGGNRKPEIEASFDGAADDDVLF